MPACNQGSAAVANLHIVIFAVAVAGLIPVSFLASRCFFYLAVLIDRRFHRATAYLGVFIGLMIGSLVQFAVFITPLVLSDKLQVTRTAAVRYGMLVVGAAVVAAGLGLGLRSPEARKLEMQLRLSDYRSN